jgi:hypothetical protein
MNASDNYCHKYTHMHCAYLDAFLQDLSLPYKILQKQWCGDLYILHVYAFHGFTQYGLSTTAIAVITMAVPI